MHTGLKIDDFMDLNPIWARLRGRSQLLNASRIYAALGGDELSFVLNGMFRIVDFNNWQWVENIFVKELIVFQQSIEK